MSTKKPDLSDIEGRFAVIPSEALRSIAGQHPTLTALALSAADVPTLLKYVRELEGQIDDIEGRIAFVQNELNVIVPPGS
jgi:hypothetical protein